MTISEWAALWCIPAGALADLVRLLDAPHIAQGPAEGSESLAQQLCRLEAQKTGARLWRNNVGAGKLEEGSFIRWGLANESKAVNARIKSSDLIGCQPVVVTPDLVGQTFGRFVAREIKEPGWHYAGTDREEAQARFLNLVNALGGDGKFSTGGY